MAQIRDSVSRPYHSIVGFMCSWRLLGRLGSRSRSCRCYVAVSAPGVVAPVMLLCGTREPIRESLPDSW